MLALGFTTVNAQENAIKANPLALLGGADLVSYERAISDNSSLVLGAGIGGFKVSGTKYSSFGVSGQYRYYFKEALNGLYAGAIVQYLSGDVEYEDIFGFGAEIDDVGYSSFGGGVKFGHQWAWDSGFLLDLNVGASYSSFSYDDSDDDAFVTGLKSSGVLPTFGLALGYAW